MAKRKVKEKDESGEWPEGWAYYVAVDVVRTDILTVLLEPGVTPAELKRALPQIPPVYGRVIEQDGRKLATIVRVESEDERVGKVDEP